MYKNKTYGTAKAKADNDTDSWALYLHEVWECDDTDGTNCQWKVNTGWEYVQPRSVLTSKYKMKAGKYYSVQSFMRAEYCGASLIGQVKWMWL